MALEFLISATFDYLAIKSLVHMKLKMFLDFDLLESTILFLPEMFSLLILTMHSKLMNNKKETDQNKARKNKKNNNKKSDD